MTALPSKHSSGCTWPKRKNTVWKKDLEKKDIAGYKLSA